jgi:UDP-glucose 4-epimerase
VALYCVTGGAGFIGSHLVEELVRRGEHVRVLDNFSSGQRENLPVSNFVEVIEDDIRDTTAVGRAVRDADYVLHLAALPSVQHSIDDPLATEAVNVTGTLNVLLAARDAQVKRVVLSSSCAIYGENQNLPLTESAQPQPLSPYAASKLAGESFSQSFAAAYHLPCVNLRYFNVFGPRQDPASEYSAVIPKFITALLADRSPTIYGDGLQSRDFVFVSNVVRANLLACERSEAIGQTINIASGEQHTLIDLAQTLNELIGSQAKPIHAAARAGEVRQSLASIDLAARRLNYRPEVAWRDGLRRTIEWYRVQK